MLRSCLYLCFSVLIVTIVLPFDVAGMSIKCKNILKKGSCRKSLRKGPVCGTDGVTYLDECALITTSCTTSDHIKKNHKGKCLATSPAPTIAPVATPATSPATSPAIKPATTPPGHACDTNPCKNKGLCLPDDSDVWEYECICQDGFAGTRCEIGKSAPPISVTAKTVPADSRTILVEWVQATSKRTSQPDGYILEQKMNSKAYQRVTSAIYGDARRYEVNALHPGSMYRFRLIAVNKAGNSRASVASNDVTLPEMPPSSPPREVSVRAKSATKIRVRWKKPYREDLNGVLLGYQVIYRVEDDTKDVEVMDPEVTYLDLMNLKPNTRYTVFVVAFNAAGRSHVGEGMTAKTFKKHIRPKPRPTTRQPTTQQQPTTSLTQQPTTSAVISGCRSNPCQNGGTCISFPSKSIPGLYTCACKSGFMGKQCRQSATPACYSTPCLNGGVCVSDGEGGYTCQCAEGFSGVNCGVSMPCRSSPCHNNGTCTPDNNGAFTCLCTDYFTGTLCDERVIGPCENMNRCLNGGTCVELNAKAYRYTCNCPPDFKGFRCQFSEEYPPSFSSSSDDIGVEICLLECGEHGICRGGPFNREMFCECDDGYAGDLCEFETGPDESSSSSVVALPCLSSPCVFGTCLDERNGSFKCLCGAGYTGSLCDVDIITESSSASEPDLGPCVVNPCQNGGVCLVEEIQSDVSVSSTETYRCSCQKGFIGDTCDDPDTEPCTPNPCWNGGTCIDWKGDEGSFTSDGSSDFSSYHCSCPLGFKGENCEIESTGGVKDPCDEDPCLNGGICLALPTTTADDNSSYSEESSGYEENYVCDCPLGFAGTNCEKIQTTNNCSIPVLENGIVNGMTSHGGKVLFKCNSGFNLDGPDTLTCTDGAYDEYYPVCRESCSVPLFENGIVHGSRAHGGILLFTCNNGYTLIGNSSVACEDGAIIGDYPECKENCASLSLENGFVSGSSVHDGLLTFTCNDDFTLVGPASAHCLDGDLLLETIPECKANCMGIRIANGLVFGFKHGSEITFMCDDEFTLVGADSALCLDGAFDVDIPDCKAKCKGVEIENGVAIGGLEHGTDISFSCDDGFTLVGPGSALCNDGHYEPFTPVCQAISTTSQPILTSAIETLAEFISNTYGILGSFSREEDGFLVISDFSYGGILTDVYFVAGDGNIPTADGDILEYYSKGNFVNNSLGRTYNNEMMIVKEPNYEVTWIAVASPSADIILSVAFFQVEVEMFSSGDGSSVDKVCASQPCQNGGVCSIGFDEVTYLCICLPGYDGVNCEIDLTPCNPSPCSNGGVCTVLSEPEASSKKFQCICRKGFTGELCEGK